MSLDGTKMGAPAKSARIAFGALVIKERLGCSDEEVVDAILENPYLQHFLGLQEFRDMPLFNPSMMVHFRARFKQADHEIINAKIIALATAAGSQGSEAHPAQADSEDDEEPPSAPPNSGKLLMDATCTPTDITSPTDLKAQKKRHRQDEIDRIPVEGKFGNAKRKRTLNRVMAKLSHTSVSVINIGLIVLNLDTWLREVLLGLLKELAQWIERGLAWREWMLAHGQATVT